MYTSERQQIATFMRRLYRQGLTTTSGGNLSWRISPEHVLLTASKCDKGCLRGDQVAILDMAGNNLTPELSASIESEMHLAIYRHNYDCTAIVHAHPVTASAFAASNVEINCRLVAESYAIVGRVARVPYCLMGTAELAAAVAAASADCCCMLLANHGVVTTGSTLLEAFDRLEVLEAAARLSILTQLLGGSISLLHGQLQAIDQLMGR